mmetsp:Transcript_2815/g.6275  ORF Transcript_2815/g.6275 Transcript_2815/m.6275 type:complete len:85 (+) Transcript_2815:52-306(+)
MGLQELWKYFHKVEGNVCTQWTVPHPARPDNQFKQFMNQDFVGQTPGRCSDAGYGKNELKFSAYVAQSNPFTPTKDAGAVVNLG